MSDTADGRNEGANDGASLSEIFRRLIASTGPISLAHYMGESNARYYSSRDPLGSQGDFVTAPEISQMFGELIGLWLADIWIRAGRPPNVHYVELGPGRGTLARDALRSMQRYGLEPRAHLVEASTKLRALQLKQVPDAIFHNDLTSVPMYGPVLIVANEFLDALPVRQLVKTTEGWREVMVINEPPEHGGFACIAGRQPMDAAVPAALRDAEEGTVLETCPGAAAIMFETAGRLNAQDGAALFIDYGHTKPRTGSTLQAVRAHRKVNAFKDPGEMDLTAHVDFAQLAQIVKSRDCQWLGTTPQGQWLKALGIDQRTATLSKTAPEHEAALAAARDRLIAGDQMGNLFKVMGLASPDWPGGVGFTEVPIAPSSP